MKIEIQWAKKDPEDWVEITNWEKIPKGVLPTTQGGKDNKLGYVCGVRVNGVGVSGSDHYAFQDGIFYIWNDDEEDYAPEKFCAREIHPDGKQVLYLRGEHYLKAKDFPFSNKVVIREWEEFVQPLARNTLHGVWLEKNKYEEHKAIRTGWRDWDEPFPQGGFLDYYQRRYDR